METALTGIIPLVRVVVVVVGVQAPMEEALTAAAAGVVARAAAAAEMAVVRRAMPVAGVPEAPGAITLSEAEVVPPIQPER